MLVTRAGTATTWRMGWGESEALLDRATRVVPASERTRQREGDEERAGGAQWATPLV